MSIGTRRDDAKRAASVRDLGYKRYDGPRLPERSRYAVIVRRVLSQHWASALVKATLIVGAFPMVVCAVILLAQMYIQAKAQEATGGALPLKPVDVGYWVYACVFWCQIWFAFCISLLAAAPSISEDVRTGAFQFYFARPVSRAHYLVGKSVPAAVLILALTVVPGLIVAIVGMAMAVSLKTGGLGDLWANLPLLLSTPVFGLLYAMALTLAPLALGSLGWRSGSIQGMWTALFFLPWAVGEGLASATDVPYFALVSIPTNLRLLGQHLCGVEPSYPVAWFWPAAVLLLLVGGAVWLLLRRLARVEVFA